MKVYNFYMGQDLYDPKRECCLYTSRTNPSKKAYENLKLDMEKRLAMNQILWMMILITDFDPVTGEANLETVFKTGTPRERLIINPQAQPKVSEEEECPSKKLMSFMPPPEWDFDAPTPVAYKPFSSSKSIKTSPKPGKKMPVPSPEMAVPGTWVEVEDENKVEF